MIEQWRIQKEDKQEQLEGMLAKAEADLEEFKVELRANSVKMQETQ